MYNEMVRFTLRRCPWAAPSPSCHVIGRTWGHVRGHYVACVGACLSLLCCLVLLAACYSTPAIYRPPLQDTPTQDQRLAEVLSENKLLRQQLTNYQLNKIVDTNIERKCETIDIAVVCGGHNATRSAVSLLKSILFHRRHALLRLHLVVDEPAQLILTQLFLGWKLPAVETFFYSSEKLKPSIEWIPNKHYSGVFGLMKLLLADCLPESLNKVIVLDTDLTFAADIQELWSIFDNFSPKQEIGLVENQSDWYLGKLWKNHLPWPAIGRGFNTGVILLRLNGLRKMKFKQKWTEVAKRHLVDLQTTSLADQDIFNAVLKHTPSLVYRLPCQWNYQLSFNTLSDLCRLSVNQVKVIHWNSPAKHAVKTHSISPYFLDLTRNFLVYDGGLLRRAPSCMSHQQQATFDPTPPGQSQNDCTEFKASQRQSLRIHLYYLDYNWSAINKDHVTLVLQCSFDRLLMLESLIDSWLGPISVSLYLSESEAYDFLMFSQNSQTLSSRRNVGYHVVYKDAQMYPVNALRNIALHQSRTLFSFLCDVDFLPSPNLHLRLNQLAQSSLSSNQTSDKVLVVPAFETIAYRFEMPENKASLVNMLNSGILVTFRYNEWPRGHNATNYSKWMNANESYRIHWQPDYEPYVVGRTSRLSDYDERFVGFGWNKVSHIMELDALGFEFHVIPDVYIIHQPHGPSLDISRYRSNSHYRRCLQLLKEDFQKHLSQTYGLKALKYLEMD